MQIDIIERDGETIIVADKPKPAETQLHGKALQDGLIAEIQAHAEAIAEASPEPLVVDGIMRSLFWSSPNPEECGEETLSAILVSASLLLVATREGISMRHALMLLPSPTPGTLTAEERDRRSTGHTARNSARSCAIATRLR